ncbi:phage GP46 family protein [Burkholderia sp. MSHR3999]|uniref:phage GP46 family protein n=1 Tax=Burkholderia sp. MSHR3999 TaxID=1542965 RepID=UPI0005AC201D|nr:phage GP46 family protein [Burkholderia sp. MSHR3999]KIP19169.1 phage GP46 family protein [Burkholderia sp. MSHR3999]
MDPALDPSTRDYSGSFTTNLSNAVYLRLETPLGSYWADPTLGSRLHELEREKDVARVPRLAVQYAEQALQPLLNDHRAQSIEVTSTRLTPGWLLLSIEVVDASGKPSHFKHRVKVL